MAKTKYRYAITVKYLDADGNKVVKEFDPAITVWFEFIGQGAMFYVQTLVTSQKIIEKENIATFDQFYIPTKNILDLNIMKTVGLSAEDKADILRDVFGIVPPTPVAPVAPKMDTVVTTPITDTPAPATDTPAENGEAKA